jgi:ATP-binding cassette subfamily A (ABC1) protein 3
LKIKSYGISVTTLEEVFLRVGRGENNTAEEKEKARSSIKNSKKEEFQENFSIEEHSINNKWELTKMHFSALIKKRIITTIRAPRTLLLEVFMPSLFIVFGMWMSSFSSSAATDDQKIINYSSSPFSTPTLTSYLDSCIMSPDTKT